MAGTGGGSGDDTGSRALLQAVWPGGLERGSGSCVFHKHPRAMLMPSDPQQLHGSNQQSPPFPWLKTTPPHRSALLELAWPWFPDEERIQRASRPARDHTAGLWPLRDENQPCALLPALLGPHFRSLGLTSQLRFPAEAPSPLLNLVPPSHCPLVISFKLPSSGLWIPYLSLHLTLPSHPVLCALPVSCPSSLMLPGSESGVTLWLFLGVPEAPS